MKSRARQKQKEEKDQKREAQRRERIKKKNANVRKGRKITNYCVFPIICGSGGSKSRFAKAAGAEPVGQIKTYIPL